MVMMFRNDNEKLVLIIAFSNIIFIHYYVCPSNNINNILTANRQELIS